MKPYSIYKPSGIEWIDDIPDHWSVKKIKHTAYVKGRVGWKGLNSSEFKLESYALLVTGTDFNNNGEIDWENCYQIDKDRYDEDQYIILMEGDLLITKDGTIGKLALVNKLPKQATLNSGIFVVRPLADIFLTKYLYWVLKSAAFQHFIDLKKTGSTIQHLYQDVFVNFAFPYPSLPEQRTIANFLETETSSIGELISKKQQLIILLQEEKTAIINEAVTKGLNPDIKMKDSGILWLGEIPEHWEIFSLRRAIKILTDFTANGSFASLAENVNYLNEKSFARVVRLTDLRVNFENDGIYIDESGYNFLKKVHLFGGEILIANVGAYAGFICMMPKIKMKAALGPNMFLLKFNNMLILDKYAYYLLSSEVFQKPIKLAAISSAQPKLNKDDIRERIILIPGIEEQKIIISHIESELNRIDSIIEKVQTEIFLLQEYRSALISEAVTGKIDVRDNKISE